MNLKFFIVTLGCQKNEYDSQVIAGLLVASGYQPADNIENADVIVLNTCCVRDKADVKAYGRLGQYAVFKLRKPELQIVVTGCLAQKDGRRLLSRFHNVSIVLGTRELSKLPTLLEAARKNGSRRCMTSLDEMQFENLPVYRPGSVFAWIPISEGCDCHCTYCIVPFVRGKMVSRKPENIISEITEFVANGGKEIMLLGQNVNGYGKDAPEYGNFAQLLAKIDRIENLERVRFTSPHPANFDEEFIKTFASLKRACEHIHLPLQSGDDTVLKRMGRKYTTEQYANLVHMLRKYVPDISITTDIIVGFPGESCEQFENTLDFVRNMQFDAAFMFAYSEREGTAAVKLPDPVPHEERMARLNKLIAVQNDISMAKHKAREGRIEEVLPEVVSNKNSGFLTGKTRRRAVVNFEASPDLIGKSVSVKLMKGYTWGFMGELC